MQVGDLVICNCESDVWYKGKPGLLVSFEKFGRYTTEWMPGCSLMVQYGEKRIRLAGSTGMTKVISRRERQ